MNIITKLSKGEVFVFGSNYAGRHGKGAAKQALKFGAVYGQGTGLMGQTYGIATKDKNLKVVRLHVIRYQIYKFLRFAQMHPELKFLVTQIGCGLAGYRPKDIAPLFYSHKIPDNVVLPEVFERYK